MIVIRIVQHSIRTGSRGSCVRRGGLVSCAAVLMTDAIYKSVFHSLRRAFVHTSTFSENSLAMRAALATIEVLDRERLVERSERMGTELRARLREALSPHEMVKEVRGGEGILSGIEFQAPRNLAMRVSFEAFKTIPPGLFCGNNCMVLKVAPPLIVSHEQMEYCVRSIRDVVEVMHSSRAFWTDALKLGRRAMSL
jgi:ornithine--oxo-acid transaminase